MSGIMQRRPITLYETLEALYQQVNAPFCAQRRPQRPALGGAGPGPGAYRPAGGAAAPAADTARQELAALAAQWAPEGETT